MDAREFAEWMEYDRIEPLGDQRQEIMLAQIPYITALVNSGRGKRPQLSDFMPKWGPKKKPTADELGAKFRAFVGMFNKTSGAGRDRKVP